MLGEVLLLRRLPAANYNMNHDMNDSYDLGCEMERKRLECAIYLKAMDKICRKRQNNDLQKKNVKIRCEKRRRCL